MKTLMRALALMLALGCAPLGTALAQDKPAAVEAAKDAAPAAAPAATDEKKDAAPAAAADAKPAEAAAAPAAPPPPNKGDITFMYIATVLVILMTIPGLALFYGGLVRTKNMLSILMQVMVVFSLVTVLWAIYGYSMTFGGAGTFYGNFDKLFLKGITGDSLAATFSKGVYIPELMFVAFQCTFAAITCALIVGAFAERIKFAAVLLFVVLWFTFSYVPIAHMVWYWDGPDAITDAKTLEAVTANAGWLWAKGALDFAGGTVVHINAGIAGLVGAYLIGKRIGYGRESMAPHSLTLTMVGASLLWVGWFGFNAGSNLEANGVTAVAFINTFVATAAAAVSWALVEQIHHKKPSMLGAATGAVAGLVAITPASGFATPMTSIYLGLLVSPICYFFVSYVKNKLKYDDTLDVFGVHCVGGIVGAIATGIVADPALGGQGFFDYTQFPAVAGTYDMGAQLLTQLKAVLLTLVWSGGVSAVLFFAIDKVFGLRPSEEAEREGLDLTEHGERAYNY